MMTNLIKELIKAADWMTEDLPSKEVREAEIDVLHEYSQNSEITNSELWQTIKKLAEEMAEYTK